MSITDEARAEAEKRYPIDFRTTGGAMMRRRSFAEGAEWLASRKPEAAPSDTDREVLEKLIHKITFKDDSIADIRPQRLAKTILAAGFSRAPQPVHVEVTDDIAARIAAERARQPEKGWDAEHDDRHEPEHFFKLAAAYYSRNEYIKALAMLDAFWARHSRLIARAVAARKAAALGGGDHAE